MDYKITLFENDVIVQLNRLSGQEENSIIDTIHNFIVDEDNCDGIEMDVDLDDENETVHYGIICNANEEKMRKFLNKKTILKLPQYGLHSWGKIEILIQLLDENDKILCKKSIDKIKLFKIHEHK
jgi:hypothetical protein